MAHAPSGGAAHVRPEGRPHAARHSRRMRRLNGESSGRGLRDGEPVPIHSVVASMSSEARKLRRLRARSSGGLVRQEKVAVETEEVVGAELG
jgi:hypothetical protein